MKLLYITNGITAPAGLERVLSIKASYFSDVLNYEVHIITLNELNSKPFYEFSSNIIIHNVEIKRTISGYLFSYIKQIRSIVHTISPDIISVCDDGLKGLFVPMWLGKKHCSIIYERHVSKTIQLGGNSPKLLHKLQFLLMNIGARSYDKFIVLTNESTKEWPLLNNIQVIPNPLPFYPKEKALLVNKKLITVGRFVPQKGYDRLIKLWPKIYNRYSDWTLHLYGTGPDEQLLKEIIENNNVKGVYLHAPVKNIKDAYIDASIYVLPSRFEGFGMVLIEAMACGLPCVSFDCPCGPADIIKNDIDGFLVPINQEDLLIQKITLLMENNKLRESMGLEAKKNVSRYSVENVCNEWDILFKKLCN